LLIAGAALAVLAAVPAATADAKPAGPHTVGIYSDFDSDAKVTEAVRDGWHLIANVAGLGRQDCRAPYTFSTGSDAHVARVLDPYERRHPTAIHPAWLSYWTVDSPPSQLTSLAKIRAAGRAAGEYASGEITRVHRNRVTHPWWVVLDPEGVSCRAGGFDGMSPAQWRAYVGGWEDGVRHGSILAMPALYVNQAEYKAKKVSGYHLSVFVAVNPIQGNTPVKGSNIEGYAAFYGDCSSPAADIRTVRSWGADYNSIQFHDSEICKP
jgi:hypothetical protein